MWRLLKNNGCREWGSNTQADLWTFTTVLWCDSEATTCGQTGMWHLSSNISACTCCHLSFIGVDVCLSAAFGHNIFLLLTCGLDHNSCELSSDRGSLGKKTGHVTSRHTWGMWPPLSPIFTAQTFGRWGRQTLVSIVVRREHVASCGWSCTCLHSHHVTEKNNFDQLWFEF